MLEKDGTFVMSTSECSCPSVNVYECIVNTSTDEGATLWNGSAFKSDCGNHMLLLHHQSLNQSCNNGSIIGNIMANANGGYVTVTSFLYIVLDFDVIGKCIECFHHHPGSNKNYKQIGSSSISGNHAYILILVLL